jgi:tRNA(Ile2) C34 agmatinyltransferase TiaS
MKVCVSLECPDKFVGGTVWDHYCPRCGKPLHEDCTDEARKLIREGWYNHPTEE